MQQEWTELGSVAPTVLVEARLQAHHAVQWVTRVARANLDARHDDSHTNLGWDAARNALLSHNLTAADGSTRCFGLDLAALTLFALKGENRFAECPLDGKRDADCGAWIDALAMAAGLRAASSLPYDIPPHPVAAGGRYQWTSRQDEFAELARWYAAAADILAATRKSGAGWSPLRCWPHHFDIATSLMLQAGDPETAPSIGLGMSPGDDYYAQPYFYVSPWPRPPLGALPDLPAPGHWHQRDFIGAVATGTDLLAMADRRAITSDFIAAATAASRRLVGAT